MIKTTTLPSTVASTWICLAFSFFSFFFPPSFLSVFNYSNLWTSSRDFTRPPPPSHPAQQSIYPPTPPSPSTPHCWDIVMTHMYLWPCAFIVAVSLAVCIHCGCTSGRVYSLWRYLWPCAFIVAVPLAVCIHCGCTSGRVHSLWLYLRPCAFIVVVPQAVCIHCGLT